MTIYSLYVFDRHCNAGKSFAILTDRRLLTTSLAVYYQDWHRSPLKPARPGATVLPCVSPVVSPVNPSLHASTSSNHDASRPGAAPARPPLGPRTGLDLGGESGPAALKSSTRSSGGGPPLAGLGVSGWKEAQERDARERARLEEERRIGGRGLPFDEEAKLVYGVVFSLRNMVKRLASGQALASGEQVNGEEAVGGPPSMVEEQLIGYSTPTYALHLLRTPSGVSFVLLSSPVQGSLRDVLRSIWKGAYVDFVVRAPTLSPVSSIDAWSSS